MTTRNRKRDGALYAGLAALVLVLVAADYAYFTRLPEGAPAPAMASSPPALADGEPAVVCEFDPEKAPVKDVAALVGVDDPVLGNPDAAITILEFFDPNCPHCKTLHPIMEATLDAYGDRIRLVYKPVVLWKYSEIQDAALFAANQEGKFSEMLNGQFEKQQPGGLSMEQLKAIAREIGMDAGAMAQRIQDGVFAERLDKNNMQARSIGLTGVPTVIFNGRIVAMRSRSVGCFGEFIEAATQ